MQKIINKSTAIKSIIIIISLCLIISIFPLRIWSQTISDTIPRTTNESVGLVTHSRMVLQSFTAGYDYLGSIRIFLSSGSKGEAFWFRMLAPDRQMMFEELILIDQNNLPGYYEVLVDQAMELGETYFFIIQSINRDTRIYLGAEEINRDEFPNAGQLYYQDNPMSGLSLAVSYNYIVPLNKYYSLAAFATILLVMWMLLLLIGRYYRKYPERDKLVVVEQIVKTTANPLIIILTLFGLILVYLQTFGPYLIDNIFFAAAILLGGGICWYGVNHDRDGQTPLITKKSFLKKWPDYLQSIVFALAIYACCEYMCAEFELHQFIAQKKQIIYFGLAMLLMMGWKQIFNFVNLIYMTVALGYGYYYYTEEIRAGMGELDILQIKNIELTAGVIVIGGLVILNVIINVIMRLIKKEMKPLSLTFGCLMLLFLSLMVVFRNTREWPIVMAVCFTLFYLQYGAARKGDIVLNICRGLILSFLWMAGYSLLYRPFATYGSVRYPMIFHTVTVTATYLAVVATAALVILLMKLKISKQLRDIWKECLLLGVVLAYLTLTISNTGIYSFIVAAVFSVLVFTAGKGRQKFRNIMTATGFIVMSLIICFPVIFFMQRNIPALVGKPEVYGYESFHQDITRGRNLNSFEYMRLGRFIDVFAYSFFKTSENSIDLYGLDKDYVDNLIVMYSQVYTVDEAIEQGIDIDEAVSIEEKKQDMIENAEVYTEEAKEYWELVLGMDIAEEEREITNGRIEHFKAYWAELNVYGHDIMGVVLPDGSLSYHAHNIYLQFAYDHGIYMGILFIIIGGMAFIRAIIFYRKNEDKEMYAALPLAIIVVVATAGMAEWIYHFSNPSGFILMLVMAPLIFGHQNVQRSRSEREKVF